METLSALLALYMENSSVTSGFPEKRLVIPRFDICWCQNEQFVVQPVEFSMIWKDHSSTEIFEIRCVFWMMWLDKENITGNHSCPIAFSKSFSCLVCLSPAVLPNDNKSSLFPGMDWYSKCQIWVPFQQAATYDDVIKWKHFPRYWPFVRGIHQSPVNSAHKSQWSGTLMFSLICEWINGWVNNREAGDLRRYCAHYDVTVMRSGARPTNDISIEFEIRPKFAVL